MPLFQPDGCGIITLAQGAAAGFTPGTSAATFYFAAPLTVNPGVTDATSEFYIPSACVIRAATFSWPVFGTKGDDGKFSSISIRVNHTTDYGIGQLTCTGTANVVSNPNLAVPLKAGDVINCKMTIPQWSTSPTLSFVQAYLFVER